MSKNSINDELPENLSTGKISDEGVQRHRDIVYNLIEVINKLSSYLKTWLDSFPIFVKKLLEVLMVCSPILLLLIVRNANQVMNELDPGGYDGIQWGASMEVVKSKYSEAKLAYSNSDKLEYEGDGEAIRSREFIFFNDKLIEVNVVITGVNSEMILQELVGKYKKYHKDESTKGVETLVWDFATTKIATVRLLPYKMTTIVYKSKELTKEKIRQEVQGYVDAREKEVNRQQKELKNAKL